MQMSGVGRFAAGVPALVLCCLMGFGLRAQETVDLELVLALDCSYSVDDREFGLQTLGLAKAFLDPRIVAAIQAGPKGAIAVTVVQWSSFEHQVQAMPWRVVLDAGSATAVAERLISMPRLAAEGSTSIASALDFSAKTFALNPAKGKRRVIDVSADGRNNNGGAVVDARDRALARGITVNGLAILNETETLNYYFELYVIGGADAFVAKAEDYDDYVDAIRRKILREIIGDKLSKKEHSPTVGPWLAGLGEAGG